MTYKDIEVILYEGPDLPIFKHNLDFKKEYRREWQKYLKHKKAVYSLIDEDIIDAALVSEANWLLRNVGSNTEAYRVKVEVGDICFIDFGQAYINEIGYQHFGLVVKIFKSKALVIPLTSNHVQYKQAQDIDSIYGKSHLLRIGLIPGMNKPSVLFLNDLKFINISRVIDIKAHISVSSKLFKYIMSRVAEIIFD